MYFQFLIEDKSTNILVEHVMEKLIGQYVEKEIIWDIKSFGGIGHLGKKGSILERKTGKLLNDLPMYMKAFSKVLQNMKWADRIGSCLHLHENASSSYQYFKDEMEKRILT